MASHAVPNGHPARGMTLEEWASLPEDDDGELVGGQLAEEELPDFVHELVVVWLTSALRSWLAPRGGFVGGSEAKLAIREGQGRKADALAYFPERRPPARGLIRIPPDLVLEVVSPSPRDGRRDRVEKISDYAAFGVRWYWLLDPELRTFEVLELGADGRYAHALAVAGGVQSSIPGCEGLSIDLDELWREIDRLSRGTEPA